MASPQSSLRSVFIVSVFSFGHLIIQFIFQVLLAKYFGASAEMDAYVAAIALPTVIASILTGSLSYAFLPVFIDRQHGTAGQGGWTMAGNFAAMLLAVALTISVIGVWRSEWLIAALHPGFSAEQVARTAQLFRILIWLVPANSLISFLQALHHCRQRFAAPALASVLGIGMTVAYVFSFHDTQGIRAVAWGVLLGAAVAGVYQLPLFLRHVRFMSVRVDKGTARCLRLMLPLVLGALFCGVDPLVDRYLASRLPEGSIAHLGYAWRLTNALLILGTSGLSIVAFPALARHASANDIEGLQVEIAHAFRFLCAVLVPVTLGLLFFSRAIVHDLFERGAFHVRDTAAVSTLLLLYLGVVWGGSIGSITAKVFYAFQDTRTPVLISMCVFPMAVLLKTAFVHSSGVTALVLITSLYYLSDAVVMAYVITRRLGAQVFEGVIASVFRYGSCSLPALLVAFGIVRTGFAWASIVAAVAAIASFLSATVLLRDEFAMRLCNAVSEQLRVLTGRGQN